jgi:hypothetical protein
MTPFFPGEVFTIQKPKFRCTLPDDISTTVLPGLGITSWPQDQSGGTDRKKAMTLMNIIAALEWGGFGFDNTTISGSTEERVYFEGPGVSSWASTVLAEGSGFESSPGGDLGLHGIYEESFKAPIGSGFLNLSFNEDFTRVDVDVDYRGGIGHAIDAARSVFGHQIDPIHVWGVLSNVDGVNLGYSCKPQGQD